MSDPRADPAPAAPRRPWWRLAGWAASLVILAATVALLLERVEDVRDLGGLPALAPAVAAVVLLAVANAVLADTWRRVVEVAGGRIDRAAAAWVWGASQLARYTVGAAQVGGRAVLGRRYGVPAVAGGATTLVEIAWQTSLTAALALATAPWWLPAAGGWAWLGWAAVVPVTVLTVGSVAPQRLLRAAAWLLQLPGVRRLGGRVAAAADGVVLSRRTAAELTGRFALNTALRLAAFAAVYAAVGGRVAADLPVVVGAYAAGQLAGRAAVFAPGGIGPREGVTAAVLLPALGAGPALVAVAAIRLLEVVAELIFLAAARARRPAEVA